MSGFARTRWTHLSNTNVGVGNLPLRIVFRVRRCLAVRTSVGQFAKDALIKAWLENICSKGENHTQSGLDVVAVPVRTCEVRDGCWSSLSIVVIVLFHRVQTSDCEFP
jgi:hypothetical protein